MAHCQVPTDPKQMPSGNPPFAPSYQRTTTPNSAPPVSCRPSPGPAGPVLHPTNSSGAKPLSGWALRSTASVQVACHSPGSSSTTWPDPTLPTGPPSRRPRGNGFFMASPRLRRGSPPSSRCANILRSWLARFFLSGVTVVLYRNTDILLYNSLLPFRDSMLVCCSVLISVFVSVVCYFCSGFVFGFILFFFYFLICSCSTTEPTSCITFPVSLCPCP